MSDADTLDLKEDGSGPALVLLSSLGCDRRSWDKVTALLSDFRVIRIDMPGQGASPLSSDDLTTEGVANAILQRLDGVNVGRFSIAGCSIGGLIAQQIALLAPGRVRALVLSNTLARMGNLDLWAARIAAITSGGMAAISEAVIQRWFSQAFRTTPEATVWLDRLNACNPQGYIALCRLLAATDLSDKTGTITAPALVIAGSEDLAAPHDQVAAFAARLPDARFHLMNGVGHIPSIERPDEMARLIRDFITRVPE